MINYEIELILTCSKDCTLTDMTVRAVGNNNDLSAVVVPTGLVSNNRHKTVLSSCYLVNRKWRNV